MSVCGEKDSLYIYIFHPLFIQVFSSLNKYSPDLWRNVYLYAAPFIVLFCTVLFIRFLRKFHIIK